MLPVKQDETEERERFEKWASSPPFEARITRWPEDDTYAWPGHYKSAATQLAWEAWQQVLENK